VAANFRYVSLSFGVGRYQPHAAADVLHNGYGDCKDKHTLLASLSESIGLRASAALINSSVAVDPDFPSPSQFDHVMTRVSVGTDEVWLDTTTEVAPFRLLMPRLRKKRALVVPEDAPARLEESPAATPMVNSTSADVDATLSESGTLAAHVRLAFSGDFELVMRSIFRRTPKAQWRSIIDAMSGRAGLEDAEFSNWKVADPAALSEQFTIEYEARKANVVTWGKKTFDLDLPLAEWIPIGPADDSNADASSIELGPSREASYELRIELPASYIARTPLSVSMKRDYGEYRADYKVDGRVFMVRRSLTFGQSELPASRKGDYAAFRRSVSGDLKQSLGLEASGVAAIGATESLKVEELYDRGTDAVESSHFAEAVTLLKRATELEPKHRAAWTNLGRAYMGLHQTDAAIDAFRKQVEIDPYDRYAYKNLGHAYWRQQKFGDAEVAFKKQLEVDPLDEFAHEGLGGIYLEQHRCEAAAPELEKAISLSPKNASLRVRLGEALLGCGHRDRALAAFGRAVEIDATPLIWNDIAYQLASNSTDLELGQRYAESAVAAMTAASRTVSLEHVTTGDLRQVASLGAYWDTLGWVYFAKADLDRAEKYVHASWLLMQHADVGDHLGQIYEKRGRRDDAVQAYALALNAERPDARIRERLAALVGVDHVDETVRKYRGQLLRDRSIAVDVKAQPGTADFFVLLDNQPGSARVENVAFISGNEGLRSLAARLRGAKYDTQFPDEAPAKILRRGTLSCGGSKLPACTFMLMLPGEAREAQRE
jgi:tetratricopeptide (TPR) repeat protein